MMATLWTDHNIKVFTTYAKNLSYPKRDWQFYDVTCKILECICFPIPDFHKKRLLILRKYVNIELDVCCFILIIFFFYFLIKYRFPIDKMMKRGNNCNCISCQGARSMIEQYALPEMVIF
jgi:hypothetical protein